MSSLYPRSGPRMQATVMRAINQAKLGSSRRIHRRRFVALFLVSAVLPTVAMAYLSSAVASSALTQQIEDRVGAVERHAALYIDDVVNARTQLLQTLAADPRIAGALPSVLPSAAPQTLLTQTVNADPELASLTVFGGGGAVVSSAGSRTVTSPLATTVTAAVRTTAAGTPLLVIAVPVQDASGHLIGELQSENRLDRVENSLHDFATAQGVGLLVVDVSGTRIVAAGGAAGLGTGDTRVSAALRGTAQTAASGSGGHDISAWGPATKLPVAVVVTIDGATALAPVEDLRLPIIVLAAALLALMFAGIWVLWRSLKYQDEARGRELAAMELLENAAYYDALTSLPNRHTLMTELKRHADLSARRHGAGAFLLFDLDGFKAVNDGMGHQAGDQLLEAVARRIESVVRSTDIFGRLGGDEFAIVAPDSSVQEAEIIVQRIRRAMQSPFDINGLKVHVGTSIGIAAFSEGSEAEAIYSIADQRMYANKRETKARASASA